ncbi:MAG: TonB-dependent receptor [Muribaculum sp.]|nr:TonB-dependent receptor [Muribaculaceae bacterium]MCM1080537.1 TonB-dependent receptor [Muribaculum sp.]
MLHNVLHTYALVFVGVLTPARCLAIEPDSSSIKMQQLSNVTVTASQLRRQLLSSTPLQTLSSEQISNLGLTDMGDAVRRFSGVSVKDYGGLGGLKTVSVRNMGAAHTAVSYDGVAVSNTQAGQIDISRFPLDNVAMMSLVVGQSDNLLQSARLCASAGVLNITTLQPTFKRGRDNDITVRISGGSFGYGNGTIRYWQKAGERTSLSVDANYVRADGNYPFKLQNGGTVTDEKRNNSAIESHRVELGLYHEFAEGGTLNVKGLYNYSRRGLPGAIIYYNPKSTERLWDQDAFLQATFRKSLSAKWRIQAQGKYSHGWTRHKGTGVEYVDGYFRETMRQDEYYLSATCMYTPATWLAMSLAQDGIVNKLRTSFPECQYPRRLTSITALNMRFEPIYAIRINLGCVYMATDEHVRNGKPIDNFSRFAPSLSLRIQPITSQQLYLRLMAKGTFRLPSFNDMYYYRIGNTLLKPEKAREFNVGFSYSPPVIAPWLNELAINADAYFNKVTDKIVAIPTTFAWKMQNFGKVHATGVDISMQTSAKATKWLSLSLQGAYTWQKALDLTSKNSKSYKNQLPYTPSNNGNVAITAKTPWITIGYSVVCVGKRYFLAQNLPSNEIKGYSDHSLSIQRELRFKNRMKMNLKLDIINLTNEQYDVIKYYPMPGRNWRLTATLNI